MAAVNAQSVEDYADRIVYRYPGGRYQQALTTLALAAGVGLKTLVNTDTVRDYVIPRSGLMARFYKVSFDIVAAMLVTDTSSDTSLIPLSFFRVVIPSLTFDGKSLVTDFYKENTDVMVTSSYLRSISIGDITMEPVSTYANIQHTAASAIKFLTAAGSTGLYAIVQPTVTFYKKP